MTDAILLSRYKLQNWRDCQRRFQLRYVTRKRWPLAPVPAGLSVAFEKGELFHRILEQHYMGLPVALPSDAAEDVKQWWGNFQAHPPLVPDGAKHPEMSLSVPIGRHFLFGRYDLLILGDDHAHILDWKTERNPRSAAKLQADWQTRLYLTMIAEGGNALGRSYTPDQIGITYWFARHPDQSVTLRYTQAEHDQNWATLNAEVARLEARLQLSDAEWNKTEDWGKCEHCHYQAYCGRHGDPPTADLEMEQAEAAPLVMDEPL